MSKNKDIEKRLEKKLEKELEKIKPEKREIKEIKEKVEIKEKIEIKEQRKEFKEPYKEKIEKIEQKEFKEIEKKIFEKGGKEIVEGGGIDPGEVFRAEKPHEKEDEMTAGAAKPKEPELKAPKEIEKIKPEKEFPDKIQKELEKIKPEKEWEKFKEIEKIKPEKEFPDKVQKELEKIKPEKEFEKAIVETPEDPTKGQLFSRTGSAEDRIGQLEDAVTKLTHFIGVDLRPDLTTGALKGEEDLAGEGGEGQGGKGGGTKPDDKKKPK